MGFLRLARREGGVWKEEKKAKGSFSANQVCTLLIITRGMSICSTRSTRQIRARVEGLEGEGGIETGLDWTGLDQTR